MPLPETIGFLTSGKQSSMLRPPLSFSVAYNLSATHQQKTKRPALRSILFFGTPGGAFTDASHLPPCACSFSRLAPSRCKTLHRSVLRTLDALSGSSPFHQKRKTPYNVRCFSFGTPGGARTPNPMIRSHVLYPIELQAHMI